MTNRNSILGAFVWMLLATTLVGSAIQPVSAGTGCSSSCVRSAASDTAACAMAA